MTVTVQYQNTQAGSNQSVFTRVVPSDFAQLSFQSKEKKFTPVPGVSVAMVSGYARLVVPGDYSPCDGSCDIKIDESVELKFNVIRGGNNLLTNLAELERVFNVAVSEMYLAYGLVPPNGATFTVND